MQNTKKLVGAAVIAGLVAGCSTPYQRMGFRGGYRDTEVAPGIVRIEVRGNAFTDVDTLENYFHQRAVAICRPRNYDWRLDSGTTRGPSSVIANRYGNTLHVYQQPAPAKGWVTGVIACMDGPQEPTLARTAVHGAKRFTSIVVQVLDVTTGKLANARVDDVGDQVHASQRLVMVRDGKVDAITPEGHRVRVDAVKADAALSLGYRILSGAELAKEERSSALGGLPKE
ncbi:hypothetical protein [Myxococcus sp. Y35]|uniref:hypothetical protein n=1 Tax=Pseudomyxococcus flavus TaxID=3115648 RepID=UPI003CF1C7BF